MGSQEFKRIDKHFEIWFAVKSNPKKKSHFFAEQQLMMNICQLAFIRLVCTGFAQ